MEMKGKLGVVYIYTYIIYSLLFHMLLKVKMMGSSCHEY